ncbi:hypothetical protein BC360_13395 [Ensifer sp. LC163]|nr:hypothetical protein BC360_13395 [Ensifer sp. LC163]OCP26448.1 hypothetical protein BC363_17060 [Ensifer sp. LC384]OCP26616.1 hypothetical protein BC361_16315 [Ensifer sp. LC54]
MSAPSKRLPTFRPATRGLGKGYITAGFTAQIRLSELSLTALLAQSPAEVHIAGAGVATVATDLFKLLQIHGKRTCTHAVDIDSAIG